MPTNIDKIRANRPALVLSLMCKLSGIPSARYVGRPRTELATLLDQYFPAKDLPLFTLAQLNEHAATETRFAADISESAPHATATKRHTPDGEADAATAVATVAEAASSLSESRRPARQILDDCDELMRRLVPIDEETDDAEDLHDIDLPVCNLTEMASSTGAAPAKVIDLTDSDTPPPPNTLPVICIKRSKTANAGADSDSSDSAAPPLFQQYDSAAATDRSSVPAVASSSSSQPSAPAVQTAPAVASSSSSSSSPLSAPPRPSAPAVQSAPAVASSSSSSSSLSAPSRPSVPVVPSVPAVASSSSSSSSLSAPSRPSVPVVPSVPAVASSSSSSSSPLSAPSCPTGDGARSTAADPVICLCDLVDREGRNEAHNKQPPFYYLVGDYSSYSRNMLVGLFSAAYKIKQERNLAPTTKFIAPGMRVHFMVNHDGPEQLQYFVRSGALIYDHSLTNNQSICSLTQTAYWCPYILNLTGRSYSLAAIQKAIDQSIKIGKPLVLDGQTLLPEHFAYVRLYPNPCLSKWTITGRLPNSVPSYNSQLLRASREEASALTVHFNKPTTKLFSMPQGDTDTNIVPALSNAVIKKAVIGQSEYSSSVAANCRFRKCVFFMHVLSNVIISRSNFSRCIFILVSDALQKGLSPPCWPKCIYEDCAIIAPVVLTANMRTYEDYTYLDWLKPTLFKDGQYSDVRVGCVPADRFSATALRSTNLSYSAMYTRLRVAIGAQQAPTDGSMSRWKLDRANNKWLCEPAAQN